MSLLDSANQRVVVYLEEKTTDADRNVKTRPSAAGIPAMARIDPSNQSGTSARRSEQDNEGFESEEVYRLRFPRGFQHRLGPQSQIEWGENPDGTPIRWAVFGFPTHYTRSPATAHVEYTIKRY